MKKIYLALLLAVAAGTAMAQQKYELGKPNNEDYRYLDNLKPLKSYVNRDRYPTFRVGLATIVNDYINNATWRGLITSNANETVAGNAMKMASCVDGNGNMNFGTVTNFVNTATNNGIEVYGHTLAWHSQQPVGWLTKLIADKPAPELTDGDVDVLVTVASKDFRSQQSVGWKAGESEYAYSIVFDATDGLKATTTKSYSWEVQFVAMDGINLSTSKTYKMTATVKGSKSGRLNGHLGDWSGESKGASVNLPFTDEWQDVTIDIKPKMESNFLLLHIPSYVGDVYIKNIKFEEVKKGKTINESDRRYIKAHATAKQENVWDNQLWIVPGSFASGASYVFKADVRADKAAKASTQIHSTPSSYVNSNAFGDINFTTEWKTITVSGQFSADGQSIALNLSELADENNYYFDNVSLKIGGSETIVNGNFEGTEMSSFKVKEYGGGIVDPAISEGLTYVYMPTTIPQTQQERHDTLVYAMDKWISGMMKACNGKVKAWDLVNEPISGGGNDGSGYYELQHSDGYKSGTWDVGGNAFYWQDHMGDLEYVRQACRLARKYGPEDVKLFINDYNLESTWDSNKKVKSLINWIKKWEADGVTKIDGIGTQMHLSYYLKESDQENQKKCITTMFQLMAKSGKLVRVSEFDMGLCDRQFGTAKKTSEITEEEHQLMADYWQWIVSEYLRIIPPAQQWGFCAWCPTDAPSNSGWRGGEPVGLWDSNYYRKHTFAGYVRGLGGETTDIKTVESEQSASKNAVFDLQGRRISETADTNSLPSGIYIVNGKKVAVK